LLTTSSDRETPSPTASASDGLSNILLSRTRKRTISTKALPSVATGFSVNTGALASLANSWRIPLVGRGRTRPISTNTSPLPSSREIVDDTAPIVDEDGQHSTDAEEAGVSGRVERGPNDARSLLRKFDLMPK
jgi:hypothetical protein